MANDKKKNGKDTGTGKGKVEDIAADRPETSDAPETPKAKDGEILPPVGNAAQSDTSSNPQKLARIETAKITAAAAAAATATAGSSGKAVAKSGARKPGAKTGGTPPPVAPIDTGRRWGAWLPLSIGLFATLVLLGGFGAWATFSEIAGAVVAPGSVEVDQNRQVVQHPDGGVVAELLVEEGDTVTAGQTLVRLDANELQSQKLIIESQLFELMARRGRLEAERDGNDAIEYDDELIEIGLVNADVQDLMDGQARLHKARHDSIIKETEQLEKRRGQIGNQIDGIDAQVDALKIQLGFLAEELTNQQELFNKGLAQAGRVLALQREEARLSGQVGELAARKAQAQGLTTEIDIEILKFHTRRREEAITQMRDQQYRELELLEQRRAIQERLNNLEIQAPVAGIIYDMRVFARRSVIRPAEPVLFIVPQDRPLIITAQVDPLHVDMIYIGQPVGVRMAAFDQRETPELNGRVARLSPDAFTDEATRRTFYRAEIELDEKELARLPENAELIPGMPVESFIRTDDRTPLAYLVQPFTAYFSRAFREG